MALRNDGCVGCGVFGAVYLECGIIGMWGSPEQIWRDALDALIGAHRTLLKDCGWRAIVAIPTRSG